jgi:hypothetical protein
MVERSTKKLMKKLTEAAKSNRKGVVVLTKTAGKKKRSTVIVNGKRLL